LVIQAVEIKAVGVKGLPIFSGPGSAYASRFIGESGHGKRG
jgi:hypothetical protein